MVKGGLGRGLSALIEESAPVNSLTDGDINELSIDVITSSRYQARMAFDEDELKELADSIRANGVVQPVLVRPHSEQDGMYELVAGERRWRASALAGLRSLPTIIREMDDKKAMEIGLIENIQRQNLNPIEEAEGYQRLMDEFDYKQQDVAQTIGKSRAAISHAVRLLTLPKLVQDWVRQGALSGSHAKTILTADDPEALAEQVMKKGLNVRQTEKLMQKLTGNVRARTQDEDVADLSPLEAQLNELTGLTLQIKPGTSGQGSVVLHYASNDELLEILTRLGASPDDTGLSTKLKLLEAIRTKTAEEAA